MKIVDRATFLALPKGTVYAKVDRLHFEGELCIKVDCRGTNDWYSVDLASPWFEGADSGLAYHDLFDRAFAGERVAIDVETSVDDGLYDEDQRFAIFEPDDVAKMIAALQQALVDQRA